MIEGILALVFFLTLPSVLIWAMVDGLRNGVLRGLALSEHPVAYWVVFAGYAATVATWVFFVGTAVIGVFLAPE